MVGGSIVRCDLHRGHVQGLREALRESERGLRATGDRGAGTGEFGVIAADSHQRMKRESLVRRKWLEPGRAGAMSDRAPWRDRACRCSYPIVGNAQQDNVGAAAVGTAPQGTDHVEAAAAKLGTESPAEPTLANNRQAFRYGGVVGRIPFQFAHGYRSVEEKTMKAIRGPSLFGDGLAIDDTPSGRGVTIAQVRTLSP